MELSSNYLRKEIDFILLNRNQYYWANYDGFISSFWYGSWEIFLKVIKSCWQIYHKYVQSTCACLPKAKKKRKKKNNANKHLILFIYCMNPSVVISKHTLLICVDFFKIIFSNGVSAPIMMNMWITSSNFLRKSEMT